MESEDEVLDAVAALADLVRRALYRHVAGAPGEVGRDEAAATLGLTRSLAAFHLDKLVEAGLLTAAYRRLSGRSGPGAGRPAKVYRRAGGERSVSLPPRSYARVAGLLAEVVEEAGLDRELQAAARRAAAVSIVESVATALREFGYEPEVRGATVRLRNCPFHVLAREYPPLVCGMNLALVEGLVAAAPDGTRYQARMDPHGEGCCVSLRRVPRERSKTNNH